MHLLKNSALAGILFVSALVSVPALAQPGAAPPTSLQSSSEFPGGIHAVTSSDANVAFINSNKNVAHLRLIQGTAKFNVPAGSELKLELGSLLVQSKTAELEAGFDGAGRPQVTCLSGLVGVTDAAGNHFRLSDNSVFSLGADGNSPNVRARTVASAPAPVPPPAPAAASPPVVTNPDQARPWAGQSQNDDDEDRPRRHRGNREDDDDGGYQPPAPPQGPSLGQTILRTLPSLLVNVLPYVLNGNNGYYPGYYPGTGYYPGAGYYPNQGYFPQTPYYPYR